MKVEKIFLIVLIGTVAGAVAMYIKKNKSEAVKENKQMVHTSDSMVYTKEITTPQDIQAMLNISIQELEARVHYAQQELGQAIDQLIQMPLGERTAQSFIEPLDRCIMYYGRIVTVCHLMTMVHPNDCMRQKATDMLQLLQHFFVDHVELNKALYDAMVDYAAKNLSMEQESDEVKHFVKHWLLEGKRSGLQLSEEKRHQVGVLKKELSQMETKFEVDLAQDCKKIVCTAAELQGVPEDFLQTLKKNDEGLFTCTLNGPIYTTLMENCSVEATRKKVYEAYGTRAYPSNKNLLEEIVKKRQELARILGYESYARYDLENQMIKTPERAYLFLDDLLIKVLKKANAEVFLLKRQLPEGVTLASNGVFNPWDLAYVDACYKKKYHAVDELKIAEYFPLEDTIQGLFLIYEAFFGLSMQELKSPTLWHEDVRLFKISKNDGTFIGHIVLDLHPRENKYGHACSIAVVPGHKNEQGALLPGLDVVIANFTKPTANKPSLLKYDEVVTFFHEFGHALHALLGATRLLSHAGTQVKMDFVELPSQLLELWMEERTILKNISKHYKTQEPIAGNLVDSKLEADRLTYGIYLSRQIMLSLASLSLYDKNELADTDALWKAMHAKTLSGVTEYCPSVHQQASFGHVASSEYAAKYYGYLWSCVIGNDIFEKIKREGLLDPSVGRAYTAAILAPGGSKDPNDMIREFLGREPKQDAFLKRYGLE